MQNVPAVTVDISKEILIQPYVYYIAYPNTL
jgi:hypothetical protein